MSRHTALFDLPEALQRRRIAEENCPHWDYDGNEGNCTCCAELAAAEEAVRNIRRRIKKEQQRGFN